MAPSAPPVVSILTTVFDKAAVLDETLDGLLGQRDAPPLEVVAVDDGSRDGSLATLRARAGADPRLRVLGGDGNRGPAIRLNQAAAAARGTWLLPVDADDHLAPNAAAWMLANAMRLGAPALFAKARRGPPPGPIPPNATARRIADPLSFAARRQLSHMGYLVAAALWRRAGGADEAVFIQDQAAQLRLCRCADAVAWTDATVYALRPAGPGNLSNNRVQQHHDRYLAAWHVLRDLPAAAPAARAALRRALLSSLWKLRRDGFATGAGPAALSAAHLRYLLNRATGLAPPDAFFAAQARALAALPGVRRP